MTPSNPDHEQPPAPADLADPLYYLHNFDTLVAWVREHHDDLLTADERRRLDRLADLSTAARALLVRLVMRRGHCFRTDRLAYPELEATIDDLIQELTGDDWLLRDPELFLPDAARLQTLAELRQRWLGRPEADGLPRTVGKQVLVDTLTERLPHAARANHWGLPDTVALTTPELFDRLRLLFFGNLYQDWSDFVVVELGHYRYEPVPLTPALRAVTQRQHLDDYLTLQQCRELLETHPAREVWPQLPACDHDNPWLMARYHSLLYELGILAERQGDPELALTALADSGHREARLRLGRLLERQQALESAWNLATDALAAPRTDSERRGMQRLAQRLARKLSRAAPVAPARPELQQWSLALPISDGSVEAAVAGHLAGPDVTVHHTENRLFTALFGLLCWDAIFLPVPGAFFHPFQMAPADLNHPDFVRRRQSEFERCLAGLADDSYQHRIRQTWHRKAGTRNPFVHWPTLSEALLDAAFACIPAGHLHALFTHLLSDLKEHRRGLPDLICLDRRQQCYQLVEVKGPGDRLQDHQRQWLEFFTRQGIPASVCHLNWLDDGDCA
ncbi:VRR-NUC domain-containing protein [Marinobacter xestospongiae]|uniref:VRR-NUC domain-containing protein n=1 Tax=Marinobacter xestospongiae TaxID=994319 RepID=UPI002006001C|nr:VRR-NUC domain-containing protein [Marinobacter xestospongiae]